MRTGDIIAEYINNPFDIMGYFICFFSNPKEFLRSGTRKIPNHIQIYIGDNLVIDSVPFYGVRISKLTNKKEDKTFHRLKGISVKERSAIKDYCEKVVGAPYDFMALVGILLFPVFRFFRMKNPFNNEQDFFCSELYAEAVKDCTNKIFKQRAGFISPYDVIKDPIMEQIDG